MSFGLTAARARIERSFLMRRFPVAVGLLCFAVLAWVPSTSSRAGQESGASGKKGGGVDLKSDKQKGSYSIGYAIGNNVRHQLGGADDLELSAFLQGVREAITAGKATLSPKERNDALQKFVPEMQRKQAESISAASKVNRQKQHDFFAANKNKDGVKATASGLQYIVLKEGTGKQPKADDHVKVHYHGTLLNGTVFDSSVDRGEPASLAVNGVIHGWTEALQLMKEGSKWRVFVPAELAYGKTGTPGGPIGPNEMLIFEIELLKVN
jgi:FKBP-type peptidyl-prolyl cis-trans isomerase FklB